MDDDADLSVLLGRVAGGDRAAFAAVYDALAERLFGIVVRVLRDRAMAEEVTQEVFVEIWRTAARFDAGRGAVVTWAATIARRRAIDRVRSEQARRDRDERDARGAGVAAGHGDPDPAVDPAEVATGRDERDRVRAALTTLPDEQRVVIELAFVDGRTHSEIAEQLDLPLGTVKGRIRLGLGRLAAQLRDRAPVPPHDLIRPDRAPPDPTRPESFGARST